MRLLLITEQAETKEQLEPCLREAVEASVGDSTEYAAPADENPPTGVDSPTESAEEIEIDWVRRSREGIFAVREAAANDLRYGLALVDQLAASDLDRVETIVQLWDADPELGVLLTVPRCSQVRKRIAGKLQSRGRLLFLTRPFDNLELQQAAGVLLERHRAMEERRVAQAALSSTQSALDRLRDQAGSGSRTTSEFMANLSHDIRSPMNAILGFSRLMMRDPISNDQRKKLGYVQDAGNRLLRLIDEILDFAELATGKAQLHEAPFALGDTVQRAVQDISEQIERKGLQLAVHQDPQLDQPLVGDDLRIRKVLGYLLENAVNHTDFGSITVASALEKTTERHVVARISVRDTGSGIDPDRLNDIFSGDTVFNTVPPRRAEGLGLGLPICRRLVELMGGRIAADSKPGGGSEFSFTVRLQVLVDDVPPPQTGRDAPTPRDESADTPQPAANPNSPARILLAEDDPLNQTLAVALLSKAGYAVDVADDGKAAIDAVGASEYHLVFMDVQMPRCDGLEASRAIRAGGTNREAQVPIVALTANASPGDRQRCLEAGANDYLSKPFTPEMLLECAKRWLGPSAPADQEPREGRSGSTSAVADAVPSAADTTDTPETGRPQQKSGEQPRGRSEAPRSGGATADFAAQCAILEAAVADGKWDEVDRAAGRLRAAAQLQNDQTTGDNALRIQVAARTGDALRVKQAVTRLMTEGAGAVHS